MPRGSHVLLSPGKLAPVLEYWTVGVGLAMVVSLGISSSVQVRNEGKRAYRETLVLYERRFRAPASFPPSSTPDSEERSCSHASPHASVSKSSRRTGVSRIA